MELRGVKYPPIGGICRGREALEAVRSYSPQGRARATGLLATDVVGRMSVGQV